MQLVTRARRAWRGDKYLGDLAEPVFADIGGKVGRPLLLVSESSSHYALIDGRTVELRDWLKKALAAVEAIDPEPELVTKLVAAINEALDALSCEGAYAHLSLRSSGEQIDAAYSCLEQALPAELRKIGEGADDE